MSNQLPQVAVVGADGFLGSHLVPALERAGREVSSFTLDIPFYDNGQLAAGIASARTIFWLASMINPQIAAEHPERVEQDRAVFRQLLDGLRTAGLSPTVVILSSGGTVYDPNSEPPYREDSPTGPISAYGRAKVEFEQMLRALNPGASVAVRVANAYGPGQRAAAGQGVIAYWMAAALEGKPITVIGERATARDYVFVSDIADALVAIDEAESSTLPQVVNVGSGQATSLGELVETMSAVVGELELDEQPARSFDVPRTWLAIELAAERLDWKPKVSLHEGLAQTWAYVNR